MANTWARTAHTDVTINVEAVGIPKQLETVVQSDTVDLASGTWPAGAYIYVSLYVGGAGDIKVLPVANDDTKPVVYKAVPQGTVLKGFFRRVYVTGTTATLMLGQTA